MAIGLHMSSGLGQTLKASSSEGFFPRWNSCQDGHYRQDEVGPEPKPQQGPFAMVRTPFPGWVPCWESFWYGPKNSGGVERTDEYHARLAEALAKWA